MLFFAVPHPMASSRDDAVAFFLAQSGGGGYLQREGRGQTSHRFLEKSPLCECLIELWALVLASAPAVQKIAEAAEKELHLAGAQPHRDLSSLASIGHRGEYPGNTRRDLLTRHPISTYLPSPLKIRVPVAESTGDVRHASIPIILPHELFHNLWKNYNSHFIDSLASGLQEFWDSVSPEDPRLQRHPMLVEKEGWRRRAVPIVVHGDGVRFTQYGNNLVSVQLSFLLSSGWGWEQIYLAASFPKSARCFQSVHGADTWAMIWKHLAHSFLAGYTGIFPAVDPDGSAWPEGSQQSALAGQEIAGGEFFIVVWIIAADCEYASNELKAQHHNGFQCCPWCPATLDNFRDLREASTWRPNIYTLDSRPALPAHPLWSLPGMTIWNYPGDFMHTFHLGVDLYLHGGTMRDLLEPGVYFHGNEQRRFDQLFAMVESAYDELKIESKIHNLRPKCLGKGPGCLKAKAAASKSLVKAMHHVLLGLPHASLLANARLKAYEMLAQAYDIMDSSGMFLSEQDAGIFFDCVRNFLLFYNTLVRDSVDRGRGHYNMTIKFHYAFHIAAMAKFLNPKAHHCFKYENCVGLVQQMGESCTSGTASWAVPGKLIDNYLRLLSIKLARS